MICAGVFSLVYRCTDARYTGDRCDQDALVIDTGEPLLTVHYRCAKGVLLYLVTGLMVTTRVRGVMWMHFCLTIHGIMVVRDVVARL